MKSNYISYKNLKVGAVMLLGILLSSCEKYVSIDIAPDKLSAEDTYSTDASATSAVLALYNYNPTLNSLTSFTYIGGLAADELQYTGTTAEYFQFSQSAVTSANSLVENGLWLYPFQVIREANLAIAGVTNSATVTSATKSQLIGEAKFFRALMNFNMVNYLGDIPLSINTSELANAYLPRSTTEAVYAQIIADLKDAQNLLPAGYAGTAAMKVRVNKWAATALLARSYLYHKEYANAEAEATQVIGSGIYSMPVLANTFINTSTETILQAATLYGSSTYGGSYRTASSADNVVAPAFVLQPDFIKSFEKGDNRKTSWIDSTTYSSVKYYRIFKYKVSTSNATLTGNEYNVLLRLAEQYLIRAEARAQQGNITGAQADLNVVRTRAGLAGTVADNQADLLTAIANERKVEFFGEAGHRWFDLKRTGKVDAVMSALRTTWKSTAALMPIPYNQILLNDKLTQNPGY